MHENPQQPKEYSTGNQQGNLLYGTEYENTGARSLDKNANKDAACSVCRVSSSTTVYTQWGRTSCSNGHVTEYSGLVMRSCMRSVLSAFFKHCIICDNDNKSSWGDKVSFS